VRSGGGLEIHDAVFVVVETVCVVCEPLAVIEHCVQRDSEIGEEFFCDDVDMPNELLAQLSEVLFRDEPGSKPPFQPCLEVVQVTLCDEAPEIMLSGEAPQIVLCRETPQVPLRREAPQIPLRRETSQISLRREAPQIALRRKTPQIPLGREAPQIAPIGFEPLEAIEPPIHVPPQLLEGHHPLAPHLSIVDMR
jgi:hypothetical protein